uniref:Protein kinase domain-containing protein n=1 Tax=Dicentrarchus labrax TaxID=13489 RepID=A0A8C4EU47_DICLA
MTSLPTFSLYTWKRVIVILVLVLAESVGTGVIKQVSEKRTDRFRNGFSDKRYSNWSEVSVHDKLKHLDKNKNNLVRYIDLYDLMKVRSFQPLCLSEIRVISQQMLVALNALKSVGLAHADIKPDNVMLANHQLRPFKLKLIDFGLATPVSSMRSGSIIQVVNYRAPEVILGLPLNEAVDMWSLGCLLAYMYLDRHLFPTQCESEVMRVIVHMQGQPDDHLLNAGIRTKKYFSKDQNSSNATWKLNESAFLSLVKRMLHADPEKRITPSEALGHRFITTKHFKDCTNKYVKSARLTIKNCQLEQSSVKFKHFVTSSEPKLPWMTLPLLGLIRHHQVVKMRRFHLFLLILNQMGSTLAVRKEQQALSKSKPGRSCARGCAISSILYFVVEKILLSEDTSWATWRCCHCTARMCWVQTCFSAYSVSSWIYILHIYLII